MARKNNSLNHKQFLAASDALRIRREGIATQRMTYQEAADFLSAKVGFLLTENNVSSICKITNVRWEPRPSTGGRVNAEKNQAWKSSVEERLTQLDAVCLDLKQQQNKILCAILNLYRSLGESPAQALLVPGAVRCPDSSTPTANNANGSNHAVPTARSG